MTRNIAINIVFKFIAVLLAPINLILIELTIIRYEYSFVQQAEDHRLSDFQTEAYRRLDFQTEDYRLLDFKTEDCRLSDFKTEDYRISDFQTENFQFQIRS